ncbi:uncharacterized protein J3R85_011435 [Psidium guajava]|nr:uncharacterized protein J3R85_011435 [Psidium guajava]
MPRPLIRILSRVFIRIREVGGPFRARVHPTTRTLSPTRAGCGSKKERPERALAEKRPEKLPGDQDPEVPFGYGRRLFSLKAKRTHTPR